MEMPPGPPPLGAPPPPPVAPPPGAPPPPAPAPDVDDEERNRRVVATTAAIALVAVAAMIASFLVSQDRSVEDDAGSASSTVPITLPAEDEAASPQELRALVDELRTFVVEERGLDFEGEVQLEVLGEAAYLDRVRADFDEDLDEDRDDIVNGARALQALGLWPAETDPIATIREFAAAASGGFYDPETDTMVVRGAAITPLLRTTLVHELTHALDDQHFDIDRPELDDRSDEAGFAFHAVVEGSAERVEGAYRGSLSEEERAEADAEEQAIAAGIDLSAIPPILPVQQSFAYEQGAAFVEAVHEAGGNRAIDRTLRRPPTTSEMIVEPEDWPPGDEPERVRVPDADGDAVDDGVIGQFLLHLLTNLNDPTGTVHPEWDGDNAVLWQEDDDTWCLRMAFRGDTAGIAEGLAAWAGAVEAEVSEEGDEVLVRTCR